ncbi:MAG: chemotaxis protein CheB [Anaerolineae bacterium]|nr:chemotaxis protein CheB [Anaerolineae bacterium]
MRYAAVVMGASAGGLTALQEVLAPLPADFPLPILIVQHRWPAEEDLMAFTLKMSCRLRVKEAEANEAIEPGGVYLAPANYHLLVEPDRSLALSVDEKVCYSRPSIDVLFQSAADVYQAGLIGVLLTGANSDGTAGLKKIKQLGGFTIAQDPATAEVDIMPNSAIRENVVDNVLSLSQIASCLTQLSQQGVFDE